MQDQGNGLQPLAFLNRWLKPTEQRYSVYERELAMQLHTAYKVGGTIWRVVLEV